MPLTATNVRYKVRANKTVRTEKVGDTVSDGGRIPHRILRMDAKLTLSPAHRLTVSCVQFPTS